VREDTWKFYKDRRHKWRWKRKSPIQNRIVEECRKGFDTLHECEEDAHDAGWNGQSKTKVDIAR
jgi:hypothetical protein